MGATWDAERGAKAGKRPKMIVDPLASETGSPSSRDCFGITSARDYWSPRRPIEVSTVSRRLFRCR